MSNIEAIVKLQARLITIANRLCDEIDKQPAGQWAEVRTALCNDIKTLGDAIVAGSMV